MAEESPFQYRRTVLRSYLLEVVRSLIETGMVRRRQGERLEEILRTHWRRVLDEVQADFIAVTAEIGIGLLGGVEKIASNNGNALLATGIRFIIEAAKSSAGGKRRP